MIFIAIAAYTDPELPKTVADCIARARWPDDLRFGICWQGDPDEPIDLDDLRRDPRIRISDHTITESRGGCWARHLAQGLWNGEEFTLQVDSHTRFEEHWDARLLEMLEQLPSEKPLITGITPLYSYDGVGVVHRQRDVGVRNTAVADWRADNGWAPWMVPGAPTTQMPARNRVLSGGFVFTLGKWIEEVPQDPEHYYWGEEFALAVRSFTWGYDMFLPIDVVTWHMLHPTTPPRRHWEHGHATVARHNAVAFERLHRLVYSDRHEALGRFGLGPVRTLRDYEVFSGFDLKRKRAHPDVYAGVNPDPVTIRDEEDWRRCVSLAVYRRRSMPWPERCAQAVRDVVPARLVRRLRGGWGRVLRS